MKRSYLLLTLTLAIFFASCDKALIENKVPVVDAGTAQTITAETDSVTLTGTATDEDGTVVAYVWSQVSGPSPVTVHTPGSKTTIASGFLNGTYVFQLTATDEKGATGVDTVAITLNRASIKSLDLSGANGIEELQMSSFGGKDYTGAYLPEIAVWGWTKDGGNYYGRHILKFKLNTIPANATILSATLYLYSYPGTSPGNFGNANQGSNNSFTVQQITNTWTPQTINFTTPPVTTTTNQVIVPTTSQPMLDLGLDVKAMTQSIVSTGNNYGIYLKLQNESPYTIRTFVNVGNPTYPNKTPKLVITYK